MIVYGIFTPLLPDDPCVWAYKREYEGQTLVVALNWTDKKVPCALMDETPGAELISNYPSHQKGLLQPYEAIVKLVRA